MSEVIEKPLGKITAVLADLGLEVTYAYDDLVFVQHCAFLLQFAADPVEMNMFSNVECDPAEAEQVIEQVVAAAQSAGFTITPKGTYSIAQNEDETIKLTFE